MISGLVWDKVLVRVTLWQVLGLMQLKVDDGTLPMGSREATLPQDAHPGTVARAAADSDSEVQTSLLDQSVLRLAP